MINNNFEPQIKKAFPAILQNNVEILVSKFTYTLNLPLSPDAFSVLVNGETLEIPERIYFDEKFLKSDLDLTAVQKDMLHALFSRHHDGHVREQCIKSVILLKQAWVIPYVIRIIGEYVIEILNFIESNLDKLDSNAYAKFLMENPKFFQTTKSRVISYWDCYYRSAKQPKENYVGYRIMDYLEKLAPQSV